MTERNLNEDMAAAPGCWATRVAELEQRAAEAKLARVREHDQWLHSQVVKYAQNPDVCTAFAQCSASLNKALAPTPPAPTPERNQDGERWDCELCDGVGIHCPRDINGVHHLKQTRRFDLPPPEPAPKAEAAGVMCAAATPAASPSESAQTRTESAANPTPLEQLAAVAESLEANSNRDHGACVWQVLCDRWASQIRAALAQAADKQHQQERLIEALKAENVQLSDKSQRLTLVVEKAALAQAAAQPSADDKPDWRAVGDGAFARPFGTVRQCLDCGVLVAGGPTRCARCASDVKEPQAAPEAPTGSCSKHEPTHDSGCVDCADALSHSAPASEALLELVSDMREGASSHRTVEAWATRLERIAHSAPAADAELEALKEAARAWLKNSEEIDAGDHDYGKMEAADDALWAAVGNWARAARAEEGRDDGN